VPGTGGYKMLALLQQHPSRMFSFPLLKWMAQFIPRPPPLIATAIYNHKTCTCNLKPTFELWAKVKYPLSVIAFVCSQVTEQAATSSSFSYQKEKKFRRYNWQNAPCPIQRKASSQLFLATVKFLSPLDRREASQAGT